MANDMNLGIGKYWDLGNWIGNLGLGFLGTKFST